MGHFSVIVATPEKPTEEVLSKAMQPFHEYEYTGIEDQYVVWVDCHDEVIADYEKATETRWRDVNGVDHDPYSDKFYREPTADEAQKIGDIPGSGAGHGISWSSKNWGDGRGYRAKVHMNPEDVGMTVVELPQPMSIDAWAGDYGGWTRHPETNRFGCRTNPNAKWGYWRVGGRYCRRFLAKPGTEGVTTDLTWEWRNLKPGKKPPAGCDQVQVANLDKAAMKAARVADRQQTLDQALLKAGMSVAELDVANAEHHAAMKVWRELPEPRPRGNEWNAWAIKAGFTQAAHLNKSLLFYDKPEIPEGVKAADWVSAAPWLTGFAFLMDGKWAENGEMGWFGAVSNEKSDWPEQFQALVESVPDNYWLSVVDCHI